MNSKTLTLAEYLDAKKITPTAFARTLKCAHSTVLRHLDGTRIPRPKMMRRICEATSGQVPPHSFVANINGDARRVTAQKKRG